jgi:uncharacterized protein
MDTKYQQHGSFSWCELLTSDVTSAKSFYGKLFNWTLEPGPVPDIEYTVVKVAGQPMGGIMAIPPTAPGMPPNWGIYITVDDVDATAKLAEEMGGKICFGPMDIPQVGRFCTLQDPQGAVISVITYLPQDKECT